MCIVSGLLDTMMWHINSIQAFYTVIIHNWFKKMFLIIYKSFIECTQKIISWGFTFESIKIDRSEFWIISLWIDPEMVGRFCLNVVSETFQELIQN